MDGRGANADGLAHLPDQPARGRLRRGIPKHGIAHQPVHPLGRQFGLTNDTDLAVANDDRVVEWMGVLSRESRHEMPSWVIGECGATPERGLATHD